MPPRRNPARKFPKNQGVEAPALAPAAAQPQAIPSAQNVVAVAVLPPPPGFTLLRIPGVHALLVPDFMVPATTSAVLQYLSRQVLRADNAPPGVSATSLFSVFCCMN